VGPELLHAAIWYEQVLSVLCISMLCPVLAGGGGRAETERVGLFFEAIDLRSS